ncbi:MAG: hypothetical protein QM775_25570 [Pirellulales bacterium]
MNNAMDVRIMFGGAEPIPMPERRMEKTMTKRGKLVTMIRMPGATDRMVRRPKVRTIQAAADPSNGALKSSVGNCWANASWGTARNAAMSRSFQIIRSQRF